MKKRTIALFGSFFMILIGLVAYFQYHQHTLLSVAGGSMSMALKKHYWSLGIDCQEAYEVQGYESPESLYKMFSLTQHQFYQLNPGVGMAVAQGDNICVKGIFDISAKAYTMSAFWPLAIGGVLAITGIGAALYAKQKVSSSGHK